MNILLFILQILLALHTAVGAVWKFSNSPEQTMPTLAAIPQGVWLSMSGLEILCALALVLPIFYKPLAKLPPIAAIYIALEMFLFCGVHISAGAAANIGPMIYWLVVAGICGFIAYGRIKT